MGEELYKTIGRSQEEMKSNDVLTDAGGSTINVFKYNGFVFPPFGELAISRMKQLDIRDDDIFVEGYPKTGCHWTYEIIAMLIKRRAKSEGVGKVLGFLEMANPEVVNAQSSPRILNSHVPFDMLPEQVLSKKTKIILTIRNPKDTVVSYYNHNVNLKDLYSYDGKFEDYLQLFMSGQVEYGCYFEYHKSWEKAIKENKDHPIIVMSYENMKEDLPREIHRLAQFLGIDVEDSLVEDIAEAAGFDSIVKAGNISRQIIRKGQVGDWKNWFTVAQNEIMDAVVAEKLSGLTIYKPRYTLP